MTNKIKLNTGAEMPLIGFGIYQIPPEETEQAVTTALEVGYRHLDTAAGYANEEAVGRAIKGSGIPRDELFVTTKLWVQEGPAEENTKQSIDASLGRLGLEYVDLFLIHQPYGDYYGEWRAMEAAHKEGKLKAIGVSNFNSDRLVDLAKHSDIVPAVNQIETHPFHQREADQKIMKELGVVHESWAPFAEGQNDMFTNPMLAEIGKAHGKSVAQVVLRWLVQRDVVVIPKSVKRERMAENFDIFDFELADDQMQQIAGLDTGKSLFFDHRDPEWVRRLSGGRDL